jgi:predicted Zn-dependent protease
MDGHANLGMVRFKQGRLVDAVKEFEIVLKQDPHAVPIRLNLGLSLMRLGKVSQASEEFQRVLEIDPTNQDARNLLAQAQRRP